MIYTSYFGNLKKLPNNITPIAICGKSPNWYGGLEYKKLAPKYDFFMKWKENHDNEYYVRNFEERVLNTLNPDTVINELFSLANSENIVLICYEKPGDFCHRHLVSKWLNENGILCQEYGG